MIPKETYQTIATFELQELTLLRYSPGLVANVEHPSTLRFSFTVSPGYVKITTYKEDDDVIIGKKAKKIMSSFSKFVKATKKFKKLSGRMPLLKGFAYSGIEMQKNDTTIAGDQYGTDTCHVDNYGTAELMFKMEPKSAPWINKVRDLYEESIGEADPKDDDELIDAYGDEYDTLGWHIESFNFPTFDSKSDSQLIQHVTIRIEKFIRK